MGKDKIGRVTVLIGGQYGSEGKGVISAHIANRYHMMVRTGGANAGHSFMYRGRKWAMQVIPCGWINFNATLVFGAGGVLDVEILLKEVNEILPFDPNITSRIFIDWNATWVTPESKLIEGGVDGELHQRIGSTGKGVGHARIGRIMRTSEYPTIGQHINGGADYIFDDGTRLSSMLAYTVPIIRNAIDADLSVLVEGTQGAGLSLVHGDHPYVTSADTNAAQFIADAGISPLLVTDILMVVRTFPIRVAGNSGRLVDELRWEDLSLRVGKQLQEITTVTKKVRRIGEWDEELFLHAVLINKPTHIALMFADYLSPEDEGKTAYDELSDRTHSFVKYVEAISDADVKFIGTGGESFAVVER